MNFFKILSGKEGTKSSSCCGVEIKEVKETQEETCSGTTDSNQSCCESANENETSSCC